MDKVLTFRGILADVDYASREVIIRLPDGLILPLEWPQGTENEFIFATFRIHQVVEITFEFDIGITHIE